MGQKLSKEEKDPTKTSILLKRQQGRRRLTKIIKQNKTTITKYNEENQWAYFDKYTKHLLFISGNSFIE